LADQKTPQPITANQLERKLQEIETTTTHHCKSAQKESCKKQKKPTTHYCK
jgi:hypothetical protein